MLCPHCHKETPAALGRCTGCGHDLQHADVGPPADAPTPPGSATPATGSEPGALASAKSADDPGDAVTRLPHFAPSRDLQREIPRDTGPLTPGNWFSPRYLITRMLGMGGMGAVYEAYDQELGVTVALKVIRPEAIADRAAASEVERRFKRELLLARKVTHKNVVRIYDLGEIDGIKYITMSYVEGSDLATVIDRAGGKLTVACALRVARQIVSGLVAAHEAGVVHRDLKPANIMIDAKTDNALIMDFGIARAAGAAPPLRTEVAAPGAEPSDSDDARWAAPIPATALAATRDGAIVGTIAYMAPEQALGKPADHRVDIYAFGLIVMDMLLGRRRLGAGLTALNELNARMREAPPSLRSRDSGIPAPLDALISRCIQPEPDARFATTTELAAALDRLDDEGQLIPEPAPGRVSRRLIASTLVVVIAITAGTYFLGRRAVQPPKVHEIVPVLIADFDNRSGDPIFDGAVEQTLSTALEGAPYITVFKTGNARSIAAELAPGQGNRITQEIGQLIARREGIKVVVAGTIDKQGAGYRVELRAIDPANGQPIATADQNIRDKGQVLSTVTSMATTVRAALGESKTEMGKLAAAETVTAASLEALRAYARANELALANKIQDALQEYQRAVELDPRFGRAYAGMAVLYSNTKQYDKAEVNYQAAIKNLDRMTDREKYRTLGTYYLNVAQNYEKAIENYETLVKLYPADDGGHGNLALAYTKAGNLPRALTEVRKSLEIYPNNSLQRYNYAMYAMYAGDFATAITEATRLQKENPTFEYFFLPLALSKLALGDAASARDAYARLAQVSPLGASFAALGQADAAMYFGQHRHAITVLREGIAANARTKNSTEMARKDVALAEAYLALGQRQSAAETASEATRLSRAESTLIAAARVLLKADQPPKALQIAGDLEKMFQRATTSYARLISGEIALENGRVADAIDAFRDAQKRYDSWFSRLLLGKAYVEAGHFAEGLAELELAAKRAGETTDVFIDDMPTLRYLPPAYYWLARAAEGAGVTAQARQNYDRYLQIRAAAAPADPLAADARKRLQALKD